MTSTDALLDTAADAARAANAAAATQMRAMYAFVAARRSDAVARGESPAGVEEVAQVAVEELAVELQASSLWVQHRLHVAETLASDLPLTGAAHGDGVLDDARVRAIASAAWRLRRPESLLELDARAPGYAAEHTLAQLRQWLRRLVARLEPDLVAERRKDAQARRGVWFSHDDDAMAMLNAYIPAADALLLERELTIAAKAVRGGDARTLEQVRADLLIDRLLGRTAAEPAGRGRFHIGVTVPLETLLGLSAEPGRSVDGRLSLDPELVRELAAVPGTLFSRVVTDPTGGVLDVTELGRFPTATLERALVLVDGTCVFPTCSAPAVSCDTDHEQPHPRGPTDGTNLWHLCRRHHRFKTRGRVTTFVGSDGQHRWRLPSRVLASRTHLRRAFTASSSLEARIAGLIDVEYVAAA
ncbi:DUF222 domain-containing protein [Aeromicrobium sp. CTD01-1L150]|uniref:HNH endonuclease signature motif containing protein n=1 Tax=Aeromicrobium sp. CTD01-1L150 TaxID=3341830 RepID=UPI0035C0BE32